MSAQASPETSATGASADTARAAAGTAATPMMAQYHAIKAGYPDCLLFYRMGDFYELFFDDAVAASATLGITLTKRGKHEGEDIPMCGVPVHAAEDYLNRLIANGHRVAVCEQTEDPAEAKKRGAKSVVRREVIRLVTPGTLTEDSLLDGRAHNYLASVARVKADQRPFAIAWIDISTGELCVAETDSQALAADLARLEPSEVVLPDTLFADEDLRGLWQGFDAALSPLAASRFDSQTASRRLKEHFGVAALEAYGDFGRAELSALGALIDYVGTTQIGRMPAIRPPVRERRDGAMVIDPATRANLELTRTLSGERRGSLLSVIDRTVTGAGARKLADRLAAPLTDPRAIGRRLDAVSWLAEAYDARRGLREALRGVPDLARALARLTVGRGGPRDLGAIRDGLAVARALPQALGSAGLAPPPDLIASAIATLSAPPGTLEAELAAALADELPLLARDGGFVRAGHDEGLDDNRRLRDDSRKVIAGLQSTYAEVTAIRALKIKHNNVLGYFIEVTAQHGATLMAPPHDAAFIHRQTLANVMRFTTPELADLQSRISAAADRALAVELEIFDRLAAAVETEADAIAVVADALAELDVAAGLADLAETARWVRPAVDASLAFAVTGGRHPVVEAALAAAGEAAFVPNDCDLTADPGGANDQRHIWLLTGPNMAGKSTFLRQNALIAILAQMGSFVPASAAHVGVVDRLFSRVGAADDLARGRSTFMVEMVETATILNQAGPRSLVILDEIGRGTATFDGLSIAWACVEHLHEVNRSRALFATHFHELTALAETLPRLANASVKVREWQGEVIFLHEVGPGAADRSYGIQVARLAGLPPAVTERAAEVLAALERGDQEREKTSLADDLPLFTAARPRGAAASSKPSAVEAQLRELLPDTLTPRDALDTLYRLKGMLDG